MLNIRFWIQNGNRTLNVYISTYTFSKNKNECEIQIWRRIVITIIISYTKCQWPFFLFFYKNCPNESSCHVTIEIVRIHSDNFSQQSECREFSRFQYKMLVRAWLFIFGYLHVFLFLFCYHAESSCLYLLTCNFLTSIYYNIHYIFSPLPTFLFACN